MGRSCIRDEKCPKYLIRRPRLWKKTSCDHHRRRIPQVDIYTKHECCPSPVVVSPVSYAEIKSIDRFESEFGQLLRHTPEYRGLKMRSLKRVLSKRTAIHLRSVEWVSDPILVSENVLRAWLATNKIPARADDIKSVAWCKSIESERELEEMYRTSLILWLPAHISADIDVPSWTVDVYPCTILSYHGYPEIICTCIMRASVLCSRIGLFILMFSNYHVVIPSTINFMTRWLILFDDQRYGPTDGLFGMGHICVIMLLSASMAAELSASILCGMGLSSATALSERGTISVDRIPQYRRLSTSWNLGRLRLGQRLHRVICGSTVSGSAGGITVMA